VQRVSTMVQPGDSAIFALLRTIDPDLVAAQFKGYGGEILRTTLLPEQRARVESTLDSHPGDAATVGGHTPNATTHTQETASSTLKTYEDKVRAQMQDAKTRLEQFEAKAKEKGAQAEVAAVNNLKTAKANIDRKLQDLKKTHDAYVTRAKADIDADVATF